MNKIIVTGASGPVGVMLIREAIKNKIEVLAIVRPNTTKRMDIPVNPLVRIIECDIENILKLQYEITEKYDVFYHLAWTNTGDEGRNNPFLQAENIQYTLKAAQLAVTLGCKVFVGAGSQAEYGLHHKAIKESTQTNPVTLYGISKLAAGQLVMEYCKNQGIRCNWVRIFTIYGPYENGYILMSYVIQSFLKQEKPILTPCEQIWDFLYCEDAVRALLIIGECAPTSKVYCLGSGKCDLLKNDITKIRDMINPKLEIGFGEKPYGEKQIMHLEADISELTRDTGFQTKYSFEEGIEKTIQWYQK
ncbi:MAG: NAD(P)-dependent oxidoreductase [Lachnospiraceae bacterium]